MESSKYMPQYTNDSSPKLIQVFLSTNQDQNSWMVHLGNENLENCGNSSILFAAETFHASYFTTDSYSGTNMLNRGHLLCFHAQVWGVLLMFGCQYMWVVAKWRGDREVFW